MISSDLRNLAGLRSVHAREEKTHILFRKHDCLGYIQLKQSSWLLGVLSFIFFKLAFEMCVYITFQKNNFKRYSPHFGQGRIKNRGACY